MTIESFTYQEHVRYHDSQPGKVVLSETAHARTTLWCLSPGQRIAPHVHAGDHVWVILEGEGLFMATGQADRPVGPGTILSAPAQQSHGILNHGQTGLVFISISAG